MDHHLQLALFHVIVISPLFLYVGLSRDDVPEPVFYTLGALGFVIAAYHGFKAYTKIMEGKSPWVNLIHILLVAPLLIILGIYGKSSSRKFFEMLLILGFASLGYHALSIIREMAAR
jgi:hypothetical protein